MVPVGQGQHAVAVVDDSQIPVHGIDTVEDNAWRTRAGQRGGDLLTDIPGLANANDDEFSPLSQSIDGQFDRRVKA